MGKPTLRRLLKQARALQPVHETQFTSTKARA